MTVLYNKYRPATLNEVVGQDHVVTTLNNALKGRRVAHAYLFAGARGTGKTSVARILAKELGATGLDLIEIDAASNRGIDDVRALREAVNFLPTQSPKKLYILDEVHMLTREAFNALLKTLEEPPEHAHFVLCTTEFHKVPLTIISRCQRFDFNLADEESLQHDYIEPIAKKEKIKLGEGVSKLIAQLSFGSYRDALGFLESLSHYADKKTLKIEEAQKILGLVNEKEARQLNRIFLQKDVQAALQTINDLANRGINFHYLIQTMIKSLRQELSAHLLSETAAKDKVEELLELIRVLHAAEQEIKSSPLPQLPLEMAVVEWSLKKEGRGFRVESGGEDERWKVEGKPLEQSTLKPPISTPTSIQNLWPKILEQIKPHNHSVEALLKGCEPVSFSDNILTLKFFYKFHKERIEEPRNKELVEKVASQIAGAPIKTRCVLGEKNLPAENAEPSIETNSSDLLKMAQEVFGGEIIE